jgi:hypothetical protein
MHLAAAPRFLPLVAAEQPGHYDAWALRWLSRWIRETADATMDRTAEVAALSADLPAEPDAIRALTDPVGTGT